jgi:TPR repeat protein
MDVAQGYERGEGVAKDLVRARLLYRQSCDAGEPFACEALKRLGPP